MLGSAFALTLTTTSSGVDRLLLLVVIFLLTGGLYLLHDFYFLGLAYVIVYCGAIAIIFLFVLMMISLDGGSSNSNRQPWGVGILSVVALVVWSVATRGGVGGGIYFYLYPTLASLIFPLASDIFNFGGMIYLAYPLSLIIVAMALFVVLLGVIRLVVV